MSIAMTVIWFIVLNLGLPFAAVASVGLVATWFIVKNYMVIILVCIAAPFVYVEFAHTELALEWIHRLNQFITGIGH
ncbi:MAG: hypothetical protein WBO29_09245 [Albidovulum sp.]